jgi:hypothetical protein
MMAHSAHGKLIAEQWEAFDRFVQGFVSGAAKKRLAQGMKDNPHGCHCRGFSLVNVTDGFVGLEKGHD